MKILLKEVITTGTGRQAFVADDISLGGKTGTTQNYRDAWFIGYTPALTATVWLGTDKVEKSARPLVGATFPAKIWRDIIKSLPVTLKPAVDVHVVETTLKEEEPHEIASNDVPVITVAGGDHLPQTNNVPSAPESSDPQSLSQGAQESLKESPSS